MNTTTIRILNQVLDTHADENISMTTKVKDFTDISKVFTDFSTEFSLPATDKNNKIFQNFWNFIITDASIEGLDNVDYRKKQRCSIDVNGVPFKEGLMKLNSISMKYNKPVDYKMTFFGNTANLVDIMGDDLISDLDWTDLNHTVRGDAYVQAGLSTAVPNLFDNKIIYPLITDNAQEWTEALLAGGTITPEEFSPAVQVKEIMTRLLAYYGFTFNSTHFDSAHFAKLYMWMPVDIEEGTELPNFRGTLMQLDDWAAPPYDVPYNTRIVNFDSNWIATGFMPDYDVLTFNITITPQAGSELIEYTFRPYFSNPVYASWEQPVPSKNFTGTGTQTFQMTVNKNEKLRGKLWRWYAGTTVDGANFNYDMDMIIETEIGVTTTFMAGVESPNLVIFDPREDFSLSFLPLKNIDFIRAMIKLYNLIIIPVSETEFNIDPYDIWKATGKVVDLTDDIDITGHTIRIDELPSSYDFKYAKPEAANNVKFGELFGEYYGDENYVDSNFVGSSGEPYEIEVDQFENMLWDRLTGSTLHVGKSVKAADDPAAQIPVSDSIYLMYWAGDLPCSITLDGTSPEITSYKMCNSYYPLVTPTQSLNFGAELDSYTSIAEDNVNLFSQYYANIVSRITNPQTRYYNFKGIVPFPVTNKIAIEDTLKIGADYFDINDIQYDISQSELQLRLVNRLREDSPIVAIPDLEPPTPVILDIVENPDTQAPAFEAIALSGWFTSATEGRLEWDEAIEDHISTYTVYKSLDDVTYNLVDTLPGDQLFYNVSGLIENSDTYYKIKATDGSGNVSEYSNYAKIATPSAITPAVDYPHSIQLAAGTYDSYLMTSTPAGTFEVINMPYWLSFVNDEFRVYNAPLGETGVPQLRVTTDNGVSYSPWTPIHINIV